MPNRIIRAIQALRGFSVRLSAIEAQHATLSARLNAIENRIESIVTSELPGLMLLAERRLGHDAAETSQQFVELRSQLTDLRSKLADSTVG